MDGIPGSRIRKQLRLRTGRAAEHRAAVVVEEPLEIWLNGQSVAVTMRTPGSDIELAFGFLVSEGIVRDPAAVAAIAHCEENPNLVEVHTEAGAEGVVPPVPRSFVATSSCGVCGKTSIESLRVRAPGLASDGTRVVPGVLARLPKELRAAQPLFEATGSLHAAGLFEPSGALRCLREDVGRHNAVDKVIGWAAASGRLPLAGHILLISGRASFEIIQKALVAGIPVVAAVSGPSSLAVELAEECGMTLIGFLRGDDCNVYSGFERIVLETGSGA